jgi:hypothetical protein
MRKDAPLSRSERLAEQLLLLLLPETYRDALIGDLREECKRESLRDSRRSSITWSYWKEVTIAIINRLARSAVKTLLLAHRSSRIEEDIMPTVGKATRPPLAFSSALGLLGGGALIATVSLSHRGPLIFLPYAAIVLATAVYLRLERVQGFTRRFALSLGIFMISTVILYLFIGLNTVQISVFGHVWRLGFMLVIGSILSAAVAQLTATVDTAPPSTAGTPT